MGWFKDATGIDSGDAVKGVLTGGLSLLGGGGGGGSNMNKLNASQKQGVRLGVSGATGLTFDESGNVIVPDYVGPGATTAGALKAIRERSFNDPLQQGAMDYYGDVLAGGTNPYLSAMYDRGAGKIRSQLDSQFASAGRYGGSDHELAMGSALGDYATNLYGGQYNADMARMAEAARLAPDAGYYGLERQLNVGQTEDALAEQARNWNYDEGMSRINDYLTTIGVAQGAKPTEIQKPDKFSQMMQLLTAGGSVAGAFMGG